MFNYNPNGFVTVTNGRSNGRSSYQPLIEGRVTISGKDAKGKQFSRVVLVSDGEIMANRLVMGGKTQHHVAYGRFETTLTDAGREVTHFHPRKGKGKHGLSRRYGALFGHAGCCHSWYKQGRLVRQKFVFDNGVHAYDWRGNKPCAVYNHLTETLYQITGNIDATQRFDGRSVFDRPMDTWFLQSMPFSVRNASGRVVFAGQHSNRQRTGMWILKGKKHYYEHGVAIPKELFETPPEKLDPLKLLKIDNAQLRMAMLAKASFKAERLSEFGTLIHRDGAMRLWDVPGLYTRILRVKCPSTGSLYYINVPKDSTQCEAARQWTFHVGASIRLVKGGQLKFAQET